ncbi:hypothetical protein B0H19DRAFT_1068473 [Mycena capillaripes]|nr:hypothetical protein B0H19DRAFT_1068473 [Mycena capillaripes]
MSHQRLLRPSLCRKTVLSRRNVPSDRSDRRNWVSLRTGPRSWHTCPAIIPPSADIIDSFQTRSVLSSMIGVAVLVALALRAAAHSVNLQILTLVNDLSPTSLLLATCLLPIAFIFNWIGLPSPMPAAACVSTSQLAAAADKDTFIFPAKDGGSKECSINGKTQDQLKEMCRQYGLGVSGNKTLLKTCRQSTPGVRGEFCGEI